MIITLPIRTVSEANRRDHWAVRAKRAKSQRTAVALALRCRLARWGLPLVVTLTRIAPRALDDDNLRSALKAVRDGVADALGVDDGSEQVTWRYAQCRPGKGAPTRFQVAVAVSVRLEDREAP